MAGCREQRTANLVGDDISGGPRTDGYPPSGLSFITS